MILDAGYDSGNGFGVLVAALLVGNVPSSFAGLTLPGNAAYTSQTFGVFLGANGLSQKGPGFGFSIMGACGMRNTGNAYFSDTASSTTLTTPGLVQRGYPHNFIVGVAGYTSDGANPVETVSAAGGFSERVDVGQNSPAHGLYIVTRTSPAIEQGTSGQLGAGNHTISAASTNRCGITVSIPVIANVNASRMRHRHMSSRRFG